MNGRFFRYIQIFMVTLIMTSSLSFPVQAENWQPVTLFIENIEEERGGLLHVYIFLKEGFPIDHEKALKSYVELVDGNKKNVSIQVPADGPFALKVHHDENGDSKVTKNWTGIFPAEGLGFSSGAKLGFGPPSFKKAQMLMPASKAVSISMRYP